MQTPSNLIFFPQVHSTAANDRTLLWRGIGGETTSQRSWSEYVSTSLSSTALTDFYKRFQPEPAPRRKMNDITRHELDAKLEAIEARMDGRVAAIEGKIDAFLAAQAVRDAAQAERNQGFDRAIGEIKSGISSMKTTVIVTAISAVLAIVFGIVTFNATLSSNMLAAFQAGKADTISAPMPAAQDAQAPETPPTAAPKAK